MLSEGPMNTKQAFRFHKWQGISWPVEYYFLLEFFHEVT